MEVNWKNWCRLCAVDLNVEMKYTLDQLVLIYNHFLISPKPHDGTFSICNDCSSFLVRIENFKKQCLHVDKMYKELVQLQKITKLDLTDINSIRSKYGFQHKVINQESSHDNTIICDILSDPLELEPEIKESVVLDSKTEDRTEKDLVQKKSKYIKKIKKPKNTTCEICSKKFCTASYLRYHISAKHSKDKNPFVCPSCQKRCTSKTNLTKHMRSHLPDEEKFIYPCQHCGKKFSSKSLADLHTEDVHNSIGKTFVCEKCGKSFTARTGLKQHIATHIKEKNLKCPSCPKMFNNTHRLNQHKIFHRDAVYPCPDCDAKFKTKMSLTHHLVTHSDVKKYKCNYCEKEFRFSKNLKHHIFLHTGDKPYKCQFCEKTFRDVSTTRNHEKTIHSVEFAAWKTSGIPRKGTKLPKLKYLLSKEIPSEIKKE